MCRYAHQDVYRLLGRDPLVKPLSVFEQRLFEEALYQILNHEFSTPEQKNSNDDE